MKNKIKYVLVLLALLSLTSCDILTKLNCDHDYQVVSRQDPTCAKAGQIVEECTKCNKTKKTTIPTTPCAVDEVCVEATCTSEGYVYRTCSVCGYEAKVNIVDKLPHNYSQTIVSPTCDEEGYTINTCSDCGYSENTDYKEALGHSFGEWEIVKEATDMVDGLKIRKCSSCNHEEEQIIASKRYVNIDYIKEPFDNNLTYDCNKYEDLLFIYNCAIVNLAPKLTCNVYEINDLKELLDKLIAESNSPYAYSISASIQGSLLTINFTYNAEPVYKTNNIAYTQYKSLNYNPITKARSDSYNDFKINNSLYTFNVSTTEQLHYALERGVKPIIKEDTTAYVVYEKAKQVLREIISDDMNDTQKVMAIYDWLVINVVYDNDLLKLLGNGSNNLYKYNGFYLEGVFLDNKAVCEGISKAMTVMCNIEGIPCVTVEGYQTQNPNGAGHAWNKVYINGDWYIVDATSGGTIVNDFEVLSYKFLFISEEEYSKQYTGNTFTDLKCEKTIDVYSLLGYEYQNNKYDFKIESQEELNNLVKYLYSGNDTNITIEFELAFNYGDSVIDEITKAFNANLIYGGYSYIDNGSIFMLIRK